MKVLICGNGPGVEKTDGPLYEFDHVVRINQWKNHVDENARVDGWAFSPYHHIGEREEKYDVTKYLPVECIWMPHYHLWSECWHVTGQYPLFCISQETAWELYDELGYRWPTSGIVVLKMALKMGMAVYATGFNFYGGKKQYDTHRPDLDREWFNRHDEAGRITVV